MKFKEIDPTKCGDCGKELKMSPEDYKFGKPVLALCGDCMKKTAEKLSPSSSPPSPRRKPLARLSEKKG